MVCWKDCSAPQALRYKIRTQSTHCLDSIRGKRGLGATSKKVNQRSDDGHASQGANHNTSDGTVRELVGGRAAVIVVAVGWHRRVAVKHVQQVVVVHAAVAGDRVPAGDAAEAAGAAHHLGGVAVRDALVVARNDVVVVITLGAEGVQRGVDEANGASALLGTGRVDQADHRGEDGRGSRGAEETGHGALHDHLVVHANHGQIRIATTVGVVARLRLVLLQESADGRGLPGGGGVVGGEATTCQMKARRNKEG